MTATLDVAKLAGELGRSADWLYGHWRELVAAKKLPPPLPLPSGGLVWSAAQVYAVLDKGLTAEQRASAAAYRVALAAARDEIDSGPGGSIAAARDRLNQRFART